MSTSQAINSTQLRNLILELKQIASSHEESALELMNHRDYTFLSEERQFFFLLHQAYGSTKEYREDDNNCEINALLGLRVHSDFSRSQLSEVHQIIDIAKKFGVVQLHELVLSEFPKLVIGCGHNSLNSDYTHTHIDADTINPLIYENPTWVGAFGHNLNTLYLIRNYSGYYQTIVDEGALETYSAVIWTAIHALLKPGGIFLARFEEWVTYEHIPEVCDLKIRALTIKNKDNSDQSYKVVTKAFEDRTQPKTILAGWVPLGIKSFMCPLSKSLDLDNPSTVLL